MPRPNRSKQGLTPRRPTVNAAAKYASVSTATVSLLVLCNAQEDPVREGPCIERMFLEQIAGTIVVPTTDRKLLLRPLIDSGIPVVCVDREIDSVLKDNAGAAREAVAHLIRNGYRHMGVMTGPDSITSARERQEGYHHAVYDAGMIPNPALERRGPFTEDSGRAPSHPAAQISRAPSPPRNRPGASAAARRLRTATAT